MKHLGDMGQWLNAGPRPALAGRPDLLPLQRLVETFRWSPVQRMTVGTGPTTILVREFKPRSVQYLSTKDDPSTRAPHRRRYDPEGRQGPIKLFTHDHSWIFPPTWYVGGLSPNAESQIAALLPRVVPRAFDLVPLFGDGVGALHSTLYDFDRGRTAYTRIAGLARGSQLYTNAGGTAILVWGGPVVFVCTGGSMRVDAGGIHG